MVGNDFFKGIDWTRARRTVINWPNQLRAIVDAYRGYSGISHGVQKDAVQNSWDARVDKKGRGWSVVFELIKVEKGRTFLTVTDAGAHGLTGRVLKPEELEEDLPPEERWGRFENVAFTKEPTEEALGSRGRGKFIFVGASKIKTILYDTLKADKTYRFGFRTIKITDSPIDAFDDEEGRKKLKELTEGVISPISAVGTRVIIVDPIDELVECVASGEFLRYIGETWWEIIQKYDADITVKFDGKEYRAKVPEEFKLPEKDSKECKVWIKDFEALPFSIHALAELFELGYVPKTKKMHMVCCRGVPVPDDIRGISIQRGGMKICSVETRYLPKEISEALYGYITLDSDMERFMLKDEGPEHYSYDFKGSIPRAVKRYVEDEITKFAGEKLGLGIDAREIRRQQQRNAERRALLAINKFAKEIGFLGTGKGPRKKKGGGRGETAKIRIRMSDFEFPRKGDVRVNYGETLRNIASVVINDTDKEIKVKLKMFLRFYDKVIKTYADSDISIEDSTESKPFGPFAETFKEKEFPDKGRYTVAVKLISLMGENKGTILDEEVQSFYLEEDPPAKGLFENCDPIEYPEYAKELLGEAVPGDRGGYILQYNVEHPAEKKVEDSEDELAEYLFRLMAFELCRLDVMQSESKLFDDADKKTPDDVLKKTLRNIGGLLTKYYLLVA